MWPAASAKWCLLICQNLGAAASPTHLLPTCLICIYQSNYWYLFSHVYRRIYCNKQIYSKWNLKLKLDYSISFLIFQIKRFLEEFHFDFPNPSSFVCFPYNIWVSWVAYEQVITAPLKKRKNC